MGIMSAVATGELSCMVLLSGYEGDKSGEKEVGSHRRGFLNGQVFEFNSFLSSHAILVEYFSLYWSAPRLL
jgi:hypothetical protein